MPSDETKAHSQAQRLWRVPPSAARAPFQQRERRKPVCYAKALGKHGLLAIREPNSIEIWDLNRRAAEVLPKRDTRNKRCPGKLTIYDVATFKKRESYVFSHNVTLTRFSADGAKLFVLTSDQTAYVIQVPK